jgi:hypothetical protein
MDARMDVEPAPTRPSSIMTLIWPLLFVSVLLPTAGFITTSTLITVQANYDHDDYVWLRNNIPLLRPVFAFVHQTQIERSLTMAYLTARSAMERATVYQALQAQRLVVDSRAQAILNNLGPCDPVVVQHSGFANGLSLLRNLTQMRAVAETSNSTCAILTYYHSTHLSLLGGVGIIAERCRVASLMHRLRAIVLFTTIKEYKAHVRDTGIVLIQKGEAASTEQIVQNLKGAVRASALEREFLFTAPTDFIQLYQDKILSSPAVDSMQSMTRQFQTFDPVQFETSEEKWYLNSSAVINLYHDVALNEITTLLGALQTALADTDANISAVLSGLAGGIFLSLAILAGIGYVTRKARLAEAHTESKNFAIDAGNAIVKVFILFFLLTFLLLVVLVMLSKSQDTHQLSF